jgi:GTPase SAR1 family protein
VALINKSSFGVDKQIQTLRQYKSINTVTMGLQEEKEMSRRALMDTSGDELALTSSLKDLQTDEQRRVLDTVAQVRKCGLDSILSLPQLVVCGDQSAGKSSVLEALTEIPFPRNDNLCTRYATEIIMRRSLVNSLTIKIIPDASRPPAEQEKIKKFAETITNFEDLPHVMELATDAMGVSKVTDTDVERSAFTKDTLSIEIEGPSRPQLTLVDIPGLIQTSTKGVSDADVDLVAEITDRYISQPRTICLAVVSATNDAANQPILRKVRLVDPEGARTLGIITKPDRLCAGSGMESKYLELARNEDVFFRLGWHVLKNRSFEQGECSLEERNFAESMFFRTSNFNSLPAENLGIDALRARLSLLLFEHIKQELPKLRNDLESALEAAKKNLDVLGKSRADALECKLYMSQLSLVSFFSIISLFQHFLVFPLISFQEYWEHCTAAVNGHYEQKFFQSQIHENFDPMSKTTIVRLRATVQQMNADFYGTLRNQGHKYQIDFSDETTATSFKAWTLRAVDEENPISLSKADATKWVRHVIVRTRGKELVGNYNPLIIGTLFWEQASRWKKFAVSHLEAVSSVCENFLDILLDEKAPKDVKSRLWAGRIAGELKSRREDAHHELELILKDLESFPINYNHYYTDTIHKRRNERQKAKLEEAVKAGIETQSKLMSYKCSSCYNNTDISVSCQEVKTQSIIEHFHHDGTKDMESFSCDEALDCLLAIYKVRSHPAHPFVELWFHLNSLYLT